MLAIYQKFARFANNLPPEAKLFFILQILQIYAKSH